MVFCFKIHSRTAVSRDLCKESKNLKAREPTLKQVGLPPTVNIMWIVPA